MEILVSSVTVSQGLLVINNCLIPKETAPLTVSSAGCMSPDPTLQLCLLQPIVLQTCWVIILF